MSLQDAEDVADLYFCPWSERCSPVTCELEMGEDLASCEKCSSTYPITDGIVEFVARDALDHEKQRELDGNTLGLDDETVGQYLRKSDWNWLVGKWSREKARRLQCHLRRATAEAPALLGAGTAFEVELLAKEGFEPARVIVSDLSLSALQIAIVRLTNLAQNGWRSEVEYCTSDLDLVPVRSSDRDIIVFECLHHTSDMHLALERMLQFGYRTVSLVEPTTNWLIRYLSRRGLAQRVEYSGVDPDRLEVPRVRELAGMYGYELTLETFWEFPVDYAVALARRTRLSRRVVDRVVYAVCGLMSLLGRPFNFGNFSVCSLRRGAAS